MTDRDIELTRRKILAGAGAVGAAGIGAGLGTSALFSDEETFTNNTITAGTLNLLVDYYSYWDQGNYGSGQVQGTQDGSGTISGTLTDVKPGDNGLVALCPRIEGNPAYLWLCGELTANDENSVTEPEADADPNNPTEQPGADIDGDGELAQHVAVTLRYCELDDDIADNGGFEPSDVAATADVWSGSLAGLLAGIENGVPLDGAATGDGFPTPGEQACFAGSNGESAENPCLCLEWEVPAGVGNEIQSDSLAFDLQVFAEQCRNNDGTRNPCCTCGPDEVALELPDGTRTCVPVWSGEESVADFYDFEPYSSQNAAIQDLDTTNLFVYEDGNGDRSLVVVHDRNDSGDSNGGTVSATLAGTDASQSWLARDDDPGNDTYGSVGSTASVDWTWSAPNTDGGALGTLSADFDLGVEFEFYDGIDTLQYLSEDGESVVIADGIANGETVSARLSTCDN